MSNEVDKELNPNNRVVKIFVVNFTSHFSCAHHYGLFLFFR